MRNETRKEQIQKINTMLTIIQGNTAEIRKNLKTLSDAEIKDEYAEINRLFNAIDVYRQHTDYLVYRAKHPEEFQEWTK